MSLLKFYSPKKNPFFKNFLEETRPPYSLAYAAQIQAANEEFLLQFRDLRVVPRENIRNGPRLPLLERLFHGRKKIECHYCGTCMTKDQATFDHVFAFSDGGSNSLSNMVLACQPCNVKKADLGYHDFLLTLTNHDALIHKISKDPALIAQTTFAMKALEPSVMQKLDRDCPLWDALPLQLEPFGTVTPAFYATLSAFQEMAHEKDADRNVERLQILLRVWRKSLRSSPRTLPGKIPEKEWARLSWYEFERDHPSVRLRSPEVKGLYSKFAHLMPSVEKGGFQKLMKTIYSRLRLTRTPSFAERKLEIALAGKVLREIQHNVTHKKPRSTRMRLKLKEQTPRQQEMESLAEFDPQLWRLAGKFLEHATQRSTPDEYQALMAFATPHLAPLVPLLEKLKKVDHYLVEDRKAAQLFKTVHPGVSEAEMVGYSPFTQAWEEMCLRSSYAPRYALMIGTAYHLFPQAMYEQGFCAELLKTPLSLHPSTPHPKHHEWPSYIVQTLSQIQIQNPHEQELFTSVLSQLSPKSHRAKSDNSFIIEEKPSSTMDAKNAFPSA